MSSNSNTNPNRDRTPLAMDSSNLIVPPNSDNKEKRILCPTLEAGAELQHAYEFFNIGLFNGKLPNCLITYTRKKNVLGHFCPDRYQRVDGDLWPELALNPQYLATRSDRESFSTLVHEQAHVARHYFGPLNRKGGRSATGYHDKPWGFIMEQVGLMPSHTGKPEGRKTGFQMTHYIIEGGPFDRLCAELLESGFHIKWHDRLHRRSSNGASGSGGDDPTATGSNPKPKPKKTRAKFTCPSCSQNAWARPAAALICGDCQVKLSPQF